MTKYAKKIQNKIVCFSSFLHEINLYLIQNILRTLQKNVQMQEVPDPDYNYYFFLPDKLSCSLAKLILVNK